MVRVLLICAASLAATPLAAQEVRVRVAAQQPPYYVGDPVVIQFTAEGFDELPAPECEMVPDSPMPDVRGRVTGVSPSVSSYVVQRNGQIFRSKAVTFRIDYLVTAERPGEYLVGPFVIRQGGKEARVDALPMKFEDVAEDPLMRVRLILPEKPVYPDQRVPVKIEWWYAGDSEEILDLNILSPLFDQFHFAPDREHARQSRLPILAKGSRLTLPAQLREEEHEGRTYLVASAQRTLIPDRIGRYPLEPITATLRRATAWERRRSTLDDFGGSLFRDLMGDNRRPVGTALTRATGESQTLLVHPFPLEGRPESFAGAVGQDFSIDVAANRTVVRVGDPIGLEITLRGEGNLENASLPPLSADGGMDPERFRLPDGEVPGTFADLVKRFRVTVRVSDEAVGEIPALAFSWFDPETEGYRTARSKPVALRVMPARIVSAADVVRGDSGSVGDAPPAAPGAAGPSRGTMPAGPAFSFSGADLGIERDAAVVLRSRDRGAAGSAAQWVMYSLGFLLIAAALADRRRRDIDPAVAAMRKNVAKQRARILRTIGFPGQRGAEEIAAALRAMVAELPMVARERTQALIAECESIVYAPAGSGEARLNEELFARAAELADQFQQAARSAQPSKEPK